jgi:hypothetical protein
MARSYLGDPVGFRDPRARGPLSGYCAGPVAHAGFQGLTGNEKASCQCSENNAATTTQNFIETHPFLALAVAGLVGYMLNSNKKRGRF